MSIGNSCMFEGRITKDIDYSTFNVPDGQGGQRAVGKARFSIAVDRVLSKDQRQKVQNGDNSIKTVGATAPVINASFKAIVNLQAH